MTLPNGRAILIIIIVLLLLFVVFLDTGSFLLLGGYRRSLHQDVGSISLFVQIILKGFHWSI